MDLISTLAIVLVCIVLEAFFSGTEIALISLSRHKLSNLVENGKRGAMLVEKQFRNPSTLYGTTSLGTNLFVVLGTSIMTAYFTGIHPLRGDLYAVLVMSPLTLFFGEIFPKAVFQRFADKVAYIAIFPLLLFQKLFYPLLLFVSGIARLILGVKKGEMESLHEHSEEEIRKLFSIGEKEFDLHPDEMMMINRIFDFRKTTVEQCMVPLVNVTAVSEDESIKSVKKKLFKSKHSRLAVYSDKIFNITGTISAFDLLRFSKGAEKVKEIMKPAFYVYLKKNIADLLPEMQIGGIQMAVVVNEYSGTVGVVTREDLVEEIIGEIEDEYDDDLSPFKVIAHNHWMVDGDVEIDLLNEQLAWNLPVADYETLSGYLMTDIERIPAVGEKIEIDGFIFVIVEGGERGITKIEVFKTGKENKTDEQKG